MDKEKVEEILKEFTEYLDCGVLTVEENGIKRKATLEDQIDFIKSRWEEASEKLYELEIETNY